MKKGPGKQLEALVGMHEPSVARAVILKLRSKKYAITEATGVQEMLDSIQQHGASHYAVYIMEANLGNPGTVSYKAAEDIYNFLKDAVTAGTTKFMAISSGEDCVAAATAAGIPCIIKPDILDYIKKL